MKTFLSLKLIGQVCIAIAICSTQTVNASVRCKELFKDNSLKLLLVKPQQNSNLKYELTERDLKEILLTVGDSTASSEVKVTAIQNLYKADMPGFPSELSASNLKTRYLKNIFGLKEKTKFDLIKRALEREDNEWLRMAAIEQLIKISGGKTEEKMTLINLALEDPSRIVQSATMEVFKKIHDPELVETYLKILRREEHQFVALSQHTGSLRSEGSERPNNFEDLAKRPNLSEFEDGESLRKRYILMLFRITGESRKDIIQFFVGTSWSKKAATYSQRKSDIEVFLSSMARENLEEDLFYFMTRTSENRLDFQNEILEKINDRFQIVNTPVFKSALMRYLLKIQTESLRPEFRDYQAPKSVKERTIEKVIDQDFFTASDLQLLSLAYTDSDMRPVIRENIRRDFFMLPPTVYPSALVKTPFEFGDEYFLDQNILRFFPKPTRFISGQSIKYVLDYNLRLISFRTEFTEENDQSGQFKYTSPHPRNLSYFESSEKDKSDIYFVKSSTWLIQARDKEVRMKAAQNIIEKLKNETHASDSTLALLRLGLYSRDIEIQQLFRDHLQPMLISLATKGSVQ